MNTMFHWKMLLERVFMGKWWTLSVRFLNGNHRILPHMGQYSVPSSHNVQSVKKPRMVYFSTLIITGILKKILEHAEVQGFAKASRPCKQIDVSLNFQKLLYKFCFEELV